MAVDRPRHTFASLGVPTPLLAVLAADGVTAPFPIQAKTLPHSLSGHDVLGRGRTGSGKTYAFALAVVARLAATPARRRPGRPRALILAPTRELVAQIDATVAPLAAAVSLRTMTVFGGVGHTPQITALRAGVDIVIACPGRLADHLAAGHASLDAVEVTVLDEADHMADLGFLPEVKRLLAQTPQRGQRLLFSATLDAGVDVLVKRFLNDPITVNVDPATTTTAAMTHHVLHVQAEDRLPVLVDLTAAPGRTLVFARTKHRTKTLTRQLVASGVSAVELHGNLAQNARTRNLQAFADGTARTLVATDIAARGIHVDDVARVIHADPPAEHKAYLHRSGRTARAGAAGTVVTLMTDEQVAEVRTLARQAGITPITTRLRPGDSLLTELAAGERIYAVAPRPAPSRSGSPSARSGSPSARSGSPAAQPRAGSGSGRAGSGSSRAASGSSRTGSGSGRTGSGSSRAGGASGWTSAAPTSATAGRRPRRPAAVASVHSGESTAPTRNGIAAFSAGSRVGRRAR
jgi:superfamily II DNA/RNA helicase